MITPSVVRTSSSTIRSNGCDDGIGDVDQFQIDAQVIVYENVAVSIASETVDHG